jgi:hypothetical protein
MTKKAYRRFLFAAIMLLMTLSLIYTGPKSRAAIEGPCDDCIASCQSLYEYCVQTGGTNCWHLQLKCELSCYHNAEICPD